MGLDGGYVERVAMEIRVEHAQARRDLEAFIDGTSKRFIEDLAPAVDQVDKKVEEVGEQATKSQGLLIAMATAAGNIIGNVLVGGLNLVLRTITSVASKVVELGTNFVATGIQTNATMQTMQIAFVTMLGSEEKALSFMQDLREEAARIGQRSEELLGLGRALFPYAKGDIEAFQEIVTLAEQLAVLDPFQGFAGARFALGEALSGNIRSLAARFELPKQALTDLKNEFEDTGDIEAFVKGMQDLVGAFGITKESIEAMGETATGQFNLLKFQFSELSRIFTMPIFDALTNQLMAFTDLFEGGVDDMQEAAIVAGAYIAAFVDIVGEAVVDIINNWSVAFGEDGMVVDLVARTMATISEIFKDSARQNNEWINENIYYPLLGVVAPFLTNEERDEVIGQWNQNFEDQQETADETYNRMRGMVAQFFTDVNQGARDAGEAINHLFPTLEERAAEYIENTRRRLNAAADEFETAFGGAVGGDGPPLTAEEALPFMRQLRDAIESQNKALESAQADHEAKMTKIGEDAAADRKKALQKATADRLEAEQDYLDGAEEARVDATKRVEEIEKTHADQIEKIRLDAMDALFDAVNARDARRIFEIQRGASRQTDEANKQRADDLKAAQGNYNEDMAELEKHRADRLDEIDSSLKAELKEINAGEKQKLKDEEKSYRARLKQLSESFQERLRLMARGWSEAGSITEEGLNYIMGLAGEVFGENGDYINLIKGFNDALLAEAIETQQTVARMNAATGSIGSGIGTNTGSASLGGSTSSGASGVSAGTRRLSGQHGLDAVVRSPTQITAGEFSLPERVQITPLSGGNGAGGVEKMVIEHVIDGRNIDPSFHALIASKIAAVTGDAVKGARRSSRR